MKLTIIGATSEVGQEVAKSFAQRGFDLHLVARQSYRLESLQQEISTDYSVAVCLYELDLLNFEHYDEVLTPLAEISDVVLFIAGYYVFQAEAERNSQIAMEIMDVNYKSGVISLNLFKNIFEKKGQGFIIGVSSVAGERGRARNYIYGSAKAGFTTYLSGLRHQLTPQNIPVLTVIPGYMNTKMTTSMDLPKSLTASTSYAGERIFNAYEKRRNVVYIFPVWRWIMLIIKIIPEFIFKKLNI